MIKSRKISVDKELRNTQPENKTLSHLLNQAGIGKETKQQ
jgi:hypothetical protein